MRVWVGGLGAALLWLMIGPASAEPFPDWRDCGQLTGDWGGRRTRLGNHGVVPFATYRTGLWSNLHGGIETGTRYEGFAHWGVHADLERLVSWTGARFVIDWRSYHGGQPSQDLVGQFTGHNLSAWEAEPYVRFYNIYLQQRLLDGSLSIKVGQLDIGDEFFLVDYTETFSNATFGDFVTFDRSRAPVYPVAGPGLAMRWIPGPRWFAQFGAYTDDAGPDDSDNFGFDSKLTGDAALVGEVGTHRGPPRLRGTYTVGAYGETGPQTDFSTGREASGVFSIYGLVTQALVTDRQHIDRLGAFIRAYGVPLPERNDVRWHLDVGFSVLGLLRRRHVDVLGVALSYTEFADDYVSSRRRAGNDVSRDETMVEITYRFPVTGWLALQPSLQFFIDPHFSRRDAIAVGPQAIVTF